MQIEEHQPLCWARSVTLSWTSFRHHPHEPLHSVQLATREHGSRGSGPTRLVFMYAPHLRPAANQRMLRLIGGRSGRTVDATRAQYTVVMLQRQDT